MENYELLKKIKADLPGEIAGIKEYASLAKIAEDSGDECWAAMLLDMAWEEHTHAKHMMHMLDNGGMSYAEYAPAFHEADRMLRDIS